MSTLLFSKPSVWFAMALAISLTAGCRRDEITHARVRKSVPLTASANTAAGLDPTMTSMTVPADSLPPPPSPTDSDALKWKLPKGWTQTAASGMRYATLRLPKPGNVEVSVIILAGEAGGELANVNRWRSQIGLGPIDSSALTPTRQLIQAPAGTVSVYDFTSEGEKKTRMVVGLLLAKGNSWFLKMVGDASLVGDARPDFIHWLETFRFDEKKN